VAILKSSSDTWASESAEGGLCKPADLDVWRVPLSSGLAPPEVVALLRPEERARAGRFFAAGDAYRFARTRAALRLVLARYVHPSPTSLVFDTRCRFCGGSHGKPTLIGESAPHFSLSYVNDLALIAVTTAGPVGVDVEYIRGSRDTGQLMRAVLSPDERAELSSVPRELHARQILLCWVRKEAIVKAIGRGLAIDPRSFAVTVSLEQPPRVVRSPTKNPEVGNWTLLDIPVGLDHVASAAIAFEEARVILRDFDFEQALATSCVSEQG